MKTLILSAVFLICSGCIMIDKSINNKPGQIIVPCTKDKQGQCTANFNAPDMCPSDYAYGGIMMSLIDRSYYVVCNLK